MGLVRVKDGEGEVQERDLYTPTNCAATSAMIPTPCFALPSACYVVAQSEINLLKI